MSEFTRRQAMVGAAVMTASAGPAGRLFAATPGAGSLHRIAQTKGMRFGSAVSSGVPGADRGSFANPAYAALLERDCGLLVPENEMKWKALRPSPATFRFEPFDSIMAYAERQGMAVRGHNLL